jgi:hypothetical protein
MAWRAVSADDELLARYAHRVPAFNGAEERWWFSSPGYTHSREAALAIIRFSLELGSPVTDILSAETFGVLVDRVAALEARIQAIEAERANTDT